MLKADTQVQSLSTESLLLALLTLQIDEREKSGVADDRLKTELLLSKAGLTYQQIATMMNKNPDAVRMMLSRLTKPAKKSKPNSKAEK
jgi:hypothetical protein